MVLSNQLNRFILQTPPENPTESFIKPMDTAVKKIGAISLKWLQRRRNTVAANCSFLAI